MAQRLTRPIFRLATTLLLLFVAHAIAYADNPKKMNMLSKNHCMLAFDTPTTRYLLLPVEEKAELCNLRLIVDNNAIQAFNVRLAADHVDYFVPLALDAVKGKPFILDVHVQGDVRKNGNLNDYLCWKKMEMVDNFDTSKMAPAVPSHATLRLDERPQRTILQRRTIPPLLPMEPLWVAMGEHDLGSQR